MPVINLNPWSYEYIRKLADEATFNAEREGLRPAMADEVAMNWRHSKRLNIPFLGDYVPEGWERADHIIEPVFVDMTGKALPGDPAINAFEFYRRITQARLDMPVGFGVIEQGQLQALVATYIRKETNGRKETQDQHKRRRTDRDRD